ncbi:MAG: Molybdopterin-synthase adenylyltransferase, partial [uncultured Thermoleophilia bacterium]
PRPARVRQGVDPRGRAPRGRGRADRPDTARADRRPRARRVRAGRDPRGRAHPSRLPRVAHRGPRARARHPDRPLVPVRRPLGVRRQGARRSRLRERALPARRLLRLEAGRPRVGDAGHPRRRQAAALLAPPAHPGGRRDGAGEAPELEGPAPRRGRARLAGRPVPGRGRGRDDRDRRRRRRGRLQPPAPDPARDGPHRSAEGRVGPADDRGAEPGRDRGRVPRAAHLRERRPDPRGLRRDRRRHRQLPDPVSAERREPGPPRADRPRVDLPLRGSADRLPAVRRAVLPLPLPRAAARRDGALVRGGRRPRRAARHHGHPPGHRGAEAPARDRRAARRPPAPRGRPRDELHGGRAAARPGVPGLRSGRRAGHLHRLRAVLRRTAARRGGRGRPGGRL